MILDYVSRIEDELVTAMGKFLGKNQADFSQLTNEMINAKNGFFEIQRDLDNQKIEEGDCLMNLKQVSTELARIELKSEKFLKLIEFTKGFGIIPKLDEKRLSEVVHFESEDFDKFFESLESESTQLLTDSISKCSYKEELFREMNDLELTNNILEPLRIGNRGERSNNYRKNGMINGSSDNDDNTNSKVKNS